MATTVLTPAANYALYPFSNAVVVAGGYLFHVMVDADYHIRVNRRDASTMADHGTVDLGYGGLTNDSHVYPTLLIDPTDNRIVVIKSGRYKSPADVRMVLWKSSNTYGGTNEQWAANDFGAGENVAYPAVGMPSYVNALFTDLGTLAVFASHRPSITNGTPTSRGLMMYRVVGNGTSKTAAQLASGSWTEIIAQPTDLTGGVDSNSGTMYPGRPARKGASGVGIGVTMYYYRYAGSPYDQWGVGFIECDDLDAVTPAWKKADGTAWTVGANWDSTARSDAVLVPWQGSSSYHHSTVYGVDGRPVIAYARVTLTPDYASVTGSDLYVAAWDGSAWGHTLVDDNLAHYTWPFIKALYLDGKHVVIDPDGDAHVESGDTYTTHPTPASGQPLGFAGIHVAENGSDVVVSWTRYADGAHSVQTETFANLLTRDFDVLLLADPLPEHDFDIGLSTLR